MTDTTNSEIKRYRYDFYNGIERYRDGDYVLYADALEWKDRLAAVTAEKIGSDLLNAALVADLAQLKNQLEQSRAECERLRQKMEEAKTHLHNLLACHFANVIDAEKHIDAAYDFYRSLIPPKITAAINSLVSGVIAQQEKGDGT